MLKKFLMMVWAITGVATFGDVAMPEVVSHRGESIDRPENTMAAFRLAFERGVDGVECDVYATSDGVPVIIHDETTKRTAGSGTNLTITASMWNQLKDVRVGAFSPWIGTEWENERLPKFEDYLALLSINNTTKCIVELKGSGANGLVSAVVAAVKAQPLATPNRVAFIAFDASLVGAVRAALPDYPALLLMSKVTDSSSSIISKLAACNATGIDIHYQAAVAQSDTEIQSVKTAGYDFWIWTCDDVNTSFALASRGVQSITTNKGKATKDAIAEMIADYNNRYDEIVEPNFPAGLTAMEPSAYVQTGLVGHFDGIRNAGASLPHDPTTRTWKNLVDGYPDAPFIGNGGYWTPGKGFYFDGSSVYARLASPGIDLNHETATIQLAVDAPTSQQPLGSSFYPGLFYSSDNDDFGFFLNNSDGKTRDTTLHWKVKAYRSDNRPEIANWGGKYVTGIFTLNNQYLFEGTTYENGKSCSSRTNKAAKQWSWGGSARETSARYAKGTYYSVRIYSTSLTESDLVWNRIVDEIRFRDAATNGIVVVSSSRAGVDGTETSGAYYVNGSHTFTAPAEATVGGCVYTNAGYKLEVWDSARKKWNLDGEYNGTSFVYTNCAANTGARITWNWRLKSGVKKIDADDYAQAGLLLHYDGIHNAGLSAAHDNAATTWKNLGSLGDANRTTFDAEHPGAWAAKGYRFAGGECFITPSLHLGRQVTLQISADYNESLQTSVSQWPSPFGPNVNDDKFNVYAYKKYATDRGDLLRFNANGWFGGYSETDLQPWDGKLMNLIVDCDRISNTSGAVPNWQARTLKNDLVDSTYTIGVAQNGTTQRKARSFSGMIYSLRLYDRTLSNSELQRNWEIDNMRFYAGAGRYTGSNLVEVVCEPATAEVPDAGCWLIRGEGVSKTFTAPAAVTVGNCTYTCAGYRLETWNAAKRMWENPVETTAVQSVELSSAESNRRLSWLYTLTTGIRSVADYDVHDYVQQGLVANYDGIRNLGPGNPHATMAQRWRDSSYRDVPMIGASNTAHKAWVGFGHHFTAAEVSGFSMTEPISLGQSATIQAVLDTVPTTQTTSYPLYFGFGHEDRSFFTRSNNKQRLEVKYPDWVGGNLYITGWEGKYFTSVISPTHHYLIQGTELGAGTARTVFNDLPVNKMGIGAPNTYPNDYNARKIRSMTGDYYALRIYNRPLTESELVHNRTVDEIRYRGVFTNANVTVVCDVPFDGVEVPVSIAAGDYEVTGSWTFTANSIAMDGATFAPHYTVETWMDGAWGEPVEHDGGSYTYTAGGAKVRLTWKWADATTPVRATWTGGGNADDLLDPANWNCLNAAGGTIENAVPAQYTTVVVDGPTTFSIPAGVTEFPWKDIRFGSADAHFAMRCGVYRISSNANIFGISVGLFSLFSTSDTDLANLNGGNTSWQNTNLRGSRVRYDGWVNVVAAQAGTWTIRQKFDDYFAFAIDGQEVVVNNSYTTEMTAQVDVSEGWHRFSIVCGDTGGNLWGATGQSSIMLNGVQVPMTISWGGAAVTLTKGYFAFGSGEGGVITLSSDCDWSALGNVMIANGATIDLNGHNLKLPSVSAECIGSAFTNSNDAVLSTITFDVAEGAVVTNSGAAICGNVKIVKKGLGTFVSMAGASTHMGGTFIDEGVAKFGASGSVFGPDGSDVNVASGAAIDANDKNINAHCIVLDGGTLLNAVGSASATDHSIGNIRLTADSEFVFDATATANHDWLVANNVVWDLGGHVLTVRYAGNSPDVYFVSGGNKTATTGKLTIINGTVKTIVSAASNGWWHDTQTDGLAGGSYDFSTPLRHYGESTVSNLTFRTASSSVTGSGIYNVYGTFTPLSQYGHNVKMLAGSTIDLSSKTGAWSTAFTPTYAVTFASGANVTIKLSGRADIREFAANDAECIVVWPAELAPAADVEFVVDDELRRQGYKFLRDDEANGLRLFCRGGTIFILR